MITGFYLGLIGFLYIFMNFKVIKRRRQTKTRYGSGDDRLLEAYTSATSNFISYVPLLFLNMIILENFKMNGFFLHGLGFLILLGRGIHFYGLSEAEHWRKPNFNYRGTGMVITFTTLGLSSIMNVIIFFG